MNDFTFEVQHTSNTITELSNVLYNTKNSKKKVVWVLGSIFCLLLGTNIIGSISEPLNYLFLMLGCFALVFLNAPAKYQAENIIEEFHKKNSPLPCSVFKFQNNRFTVSTKNYESKEDAHLYKDCHRLLMHKDALYYFLSKDAAFMFPISALPSGQIEAFKSYLEKKTGLQFTTMNQWWNVSLRSLFRQKKNTR